MVAPGTTLGTLPGMVLSGSVNLALPAVRLRNEMGSPEQAKIVWSIRPSKDEIKLSPSLMSHKSVFRMRFAQQQRAAQPWYLSFFFSGNAPEGLFPR